MSNFPAFYEHNRDRPSPDSIGSKWQVKPGGDSPFERGGDARRKFLIKPLQETDLGAWPNLFLTHKRDHVKTQTNEKTWFI